MSRRAGVPKPRWTDADLGFMQDHADWPHARVAQALGRSVQSVKHKRMSLARGEVVKSEPWTEMELEILVEFGSWATADQLAEKLPGRSVDAIYHRRQQLGIASPGGGMKLPQVIGARPLLAKTCTMCGRLLQAEWFSFKRTVRQWNPSCRICESNRGTAYKVGRDQRGVVKSDKSAARLQALTIPRATRRGMEWTEKEHKVLSDPDLTLLQKALLLNRTYIAVKNVCSTSGYKSHVGLGEPTDLWRIFNPNDAAA